MALDPILCNKISVESNKGEEEKTERVRERERKSA
jgi:hypothetical protein